MPKRLEGSGQQRARVGRRVAADGFDVDIGENLTKEAMRAAIDRFYGKIKPGSTRCFFSAATASSPTGRPTSSGECADLDRGRRAA
jgi:hypothetical protein